jgi:hypothetical protein
MDLRLNKPIVGVLEGIGRGISRDFSSADSPNEWPDSVSLSEI